MAWSGTREPKPGKARDNAPDIDTLRQVWRALETEPPSLRDLTRFLLLTPLRISEASGLRWERSTWSGAGSGSTAHG